jgi:F0F1-type ATP synthase membrane subunit a
MVAIVEIVVEIVQGTIEDVVTHQKLKQVDPV